jgi:polyhydroxybutyrate depolymerase
MFRARFTLSVLLLSLLPISQSQAADVVYPGERPFTLVLPSNYQPGTPAPLIIGLHGYTAESPYAQNYFALGKVADEKGILTVYPSGSKDTNGYLFWNATPACCNFDSNSVDDEAYLLSIIDSVSKDHTVDPARIYIIGHSNGGFMAHRMACNQSDRIAAIVSLAGATYSNPKSCNPTSPVSVLQIHGSNDEVISYTGGYLFSSAYPSARRTIDLWGKLNECGKKPYRVLPRLDLDRKISGLETTVLRYKGCKTGANSELWTINKGKHSPELSATFAKSVIDYLLAHPKKSV